MQYTELYAQELISVDERTFDRSGLADPTVWDSKGIRTRHTCPQRIQIGLKFSPANSFTSSYKIAQILFQTQDRHPECMRLSRLCNLNQSQCVRSLIARLKLRPNQLIIAAGSRLISYNNPPFLDIFMSISSTQSDNWSQLSLGTSTRSFSTGPDLWLEPEGPLSGGLDTIPDQLLAI